MLRQHYQITRKESLGASWLKKYIFRCLQYIHYAKAGMLMICKSILFITLLSVVLLPLFGLLFYLNEDDTPDRYHQ
ncbi:MAG TPA: hypothetical protein V6D28_16820 [Leptolyngbyaceae cyanobacterium]|nr:hypothetical protein [Nostocaceae cyanobacterium]